MAGFGFLFLAPIALGLAPSWKSLGTGLMRDRDCRDFDTREEAQALYDAGEGRDWHNLDANRDGRACEWLPSAES